MGQSFIESTSSICSVPRFLKMVRMMRKPDGGFGGRHDHDEERVDVTIDALKLIRKRHKAEVDGVQHKLDGHKDSDDALAVDKAGDASAKQDGTQNQVPGQRNVTHLIDLLSRENHGADDGNQDQNGSDLERQEVFRE